MALKLECFKSTNTIVKLAKRLKKYYLNFDENKFFVYADLLEIDRNKKISKFSSGQYERLVFAVALSHNTKMLFVDETTALIDPIIKEKLFNIFLEFTENGGSILISSHILSDLDKICDKVLILENGSIYIEDNVDNIKEKYAVIDVKDEDIPTIEKEAILSIKRNKFSNSLLVKKDKINSSYLNNPANLDVIITRLLEMKVKENDKI